MDDLGSPSSINPDADSALHGPGAAGLGSRSVKRPRPVKSCTECRKRKLKCDRLLPCSQCQKSQRTCKYAPDGDPANLSDCSDGETVDRPVKRSWTQPLNLRPPEGQSPGGSSTLLEDHAARLDRLERILLAKSPPAADISSRYGRPAAAPITIRGLTVKGGIRTRFFGQMSTRVLLNLFEEAKEFMFSRNKPADIRDLFINLQKIHMALSDEHTRATTPLPMFVTSATPPEHRMRNILPSRPVCDHLLRTYITGTETIYRTIHIPSFMRQYEQYWNGEQVPEVFLPQLLCMLCIGYRFYGAGKGLMYDREGIHIPTASALVRMWLDNVRGKQLDYSTLQTEVLSMCARRMVDPRDQESWRHIGLIVRMAMTMGLHRDPSEFGQKITPFWGEQRRKLWYTILEFDIQFSMQCNLPTCVRLGDYTCQPPRNINDDEIHPDIEELPETKPIDQHTDSRIQAFAAGTIALRFKVVDLINRSDTLSSFEQVLDVGTELEKTFEDIRYALPRSQEVNPMEARRQWMTRVILDMHVRRAILALYRPFALGGPDAPQQIMTGYLRSSMILLSYLDDMDRTAPDYAHVWHLQHLVLKQDILQALFSVCYYIRHTTQDAQSPMSSNWGSSTRGSEHTIEESCQAASESSLLLTTPRLKRKVEEVLNDLMVRIREIGTDVKDLVALTAVLGICCGGSYDQKRDRIKIGLQNVLEAGLQSMHANQEAIAAMPLSSPTSQHATHDVHSQGNFTAQPASHALSSEMITDDQATWDTEFWMTG
ncbi:fungal-specific transcription factor domain-domain-containing protein [Microdochium bolleyi]|uniref:Fungal-specific transcription factor domain-domain-containing protein n=1 Tax=Microdochium bolleyi TaxID=196109 RepID=A0A136IPC6_9PEZI|nr:fungal-specific transcription factor domain-domain-containing protein [Microdochium bolleyi]